jgi:hypothetical protein
MAAAVAALSSAGYMQPAGLEWRLRLSTQAARLRFPCTRLRVFAQRLRPCQSAGTCWLLVAEGWQERSKRCSPPHVSRTTLHHPRVATQDRYCCSRLVAAGSKAGVAVVSAVPWQVVSPCPGGGVGPDISTPPQGGGGEWGYM